MLSATGKGDTDQARAQQAFLSAALSAAALEPAKARAAAIEQIVKRQKTLRPVTRATCSRRWSRAA